MGGDSSSNYYSSGKCHTYLYSSLEEEFSRNFYSVVEVTALMPCTSIVGGRSYVSSVSRSR